MQRPPTDSEEFRHQCEVRWCIRQGPEWFKTYVRGVTTARGREAARRLTADMEAQIAAGNLGTHGEWLSVTTRAKARTGTRA